jgi:hypothetical protein
MNDNLSTVVGGELYTIRCILVEIKQILYVIGFVIVLFGITHW